jgi:Ca2+-binding EF-hand superfamily protein
METLRYEELKVDFLEMFHVVDKSRLSARKGYVKSDDVPRIFKLNGIKLPDDRMKNFVSFFDNGGKCYYNNVANWLFLGEDLLGCLHDRIRCSFIALANRGLDLKRAIQNLDSKKRGHIPTRSFIREVEKAGLPINSCELQALCFKYDDRNDGDKFDFRRFLSQVTKRGDKSTQEQDKARKEHRRSRAKYTKKEKHMLLDGELQDQLHRLVLDQRKASGEVDSMLKEFRKADPEGKGYVSKKDFSTLMHSWKVPLTDDEIDAIAKSFSCVSRPSPLL